MNITVVSGLPRSGTSMMMKILHAGGMEVAEDNARVADIDNPEGYYELEKVKEIRQDASWLEHLDGKAVKMVSMLLYHLPPDKSYKIIFMRRDIGEILASQEKMLRRRGLGGGGSAEEMAGLYQRHLDEVGGWLEKQDNMQVLYVSYNDVISDPRGNALKVSGFLGGGLDVNRMKEVVDGSLYRNRMAEAAGRAPAPAAGAEEAPAEREKIEEQLRALGYM